MKRSILIALIFFALSPISVSAQVSIGKFYSQGTYKNKPLDWVEIVNNSSSQINLKNYSIKDSNLSETNTYEFEGDTLLDSGQSCVKEVGQILNKDKDIIYIFSGADKIYCLEYGSSSSDCNHATEIGTNPDKPVAECVSQASASTPRPKDDQPLAETTTPAPTAQLKLTTTPSQSASNSPQPSQSPKPEVKAAITENNEPEAVKFEQNLESENTQNNWFAYLLVVSGLALSGYGILLLHNKLKGKYNDEYGQFKEN